LVKIIQSPPLGLKIDVSVDVHGHFDSAVTDDLHHDSWVDPHRQQQTDAGCAAGCEVAIDAGSATRTDWSTCGRGSAAPTVCHSWCRRRSHRHHSRPVTGSGPERARSEPTTPGVVTESSDLSHASSSVAHGACRRIVGRTGQPSAFAFRNRCPPIAIRTPRSDGGRASASWSTARDCVHPRWRRAGSSLLDRQRFLDYRPWRFDPHELDDVAGARAAFPLRKAGGVLAIAGAPATKGDHWTAWRANDVREMRINPDGLHPTPVEEHSKVVRTRTALLVSCVRDSFQ